MKYIVLQRFKDKYNPEIKYQVGDIMDITDKRAKEILKKGELIKKVEEPELKKLEIEEETLY